MAEGAVFYVGVFTVVAGLAGIVGMGFWSIYNPYKGGKFNQNNELGAGCGRRADVRTSK